MLDVLPVLSTRKSRNPASRAAQIIMSTEALSDSPSAETRHDMPVQVRREREAERQEGGQKGERKREDEGNERAHTIFL